MNTDMKDQTILRNNDILVRQMKKDGRTSKEIAEAVGVNSVFAVRTYCHINNILLPKGRGQFRTNKESEVADKVREATNDMVEYVSGYHNKESMIRVRCLKCGGIFERTFHNITTNHTAVCPYCKESEIKKRYAIVEAKKRERAIKAAERKAEAEQKQLWRVVPHLCPVCGAITTRRLYCSNVCSRKAHNTTHEHKRRIRIDNATVDSDITVLGLFLRDKGVCSICGKRCDTNDYKMDGDTFIAGNDYPSIDHIIPLSKGGEHSWDNVQLAHRICNTRKRDHIYGEGIRTGVL